MEETLRSVLVADAGLSALVGERIIWGARPQGELLPCLVLHRVTGARDYHMTGRSGLVDSLVQADCWAETWLAAKDVSRALLEALDGLTLSPFQKAFVTSERDTFETDDQGRSFYRTMLEFRVWHADAV
jgi:hypothetical protein